MADPARIAHLRGLDAHLRRHIIAQDHVLPRVAAVFARGELGVTDPIRPRGSILLVGPTGSGKTETFSCAIDYTFGPGHLTVFDMSEYQDQSAVTKLIGADRDDPGLLGRALQNRPRGGLLFDEMEKAYPLVMDLFLQILWNGRVTLATGETVSFRDHYVGFASNIGGAEAMRMTQSKFASVEQAVLRRVTQNLRPEFVARIDETGHVYLTGRIKDIIVLANGEKMPPGDIEEAILGDSLFEQALVLGEGKSYLSALVVVNPARWEEAAKAGGIDPVVLASPGAEKIVLERIAARMRPFPGYAQIRRAAISAEPWSVENGLLTPTLKAKRAQISERNATALARIYEGH